MADRYGSDFITIMDEDGTEFELEVLSSLEYNGSMYYAVTLAGGEDENYTVDILKGVDEDGEEILCAIEDQEEYEAVNNLLMDQLYEDEE